MKLRARKINFNTGGPFVVVLNENDAKRLDVRALDRVNIKNVEAIVDISKGNHGVSVKEGEIGVLIEAFENLKLKNNEIMDISPANKPESLIYIRKKLDDKKLNDKEINAIIKDVVNNRLSETELTYFVSGCYDNGLEMDEIVSLTKAIVEHGGRLKLGNKIILDKHCVGGLAGNRTSMVIVPIIAAAGYTIPKTSSRAISSASVAYNTPVFIKDRSENKIIEIGKFVDDLMRGNGFKEWTNCHYLKLKENYKCLAFDNNNKIHYVKITGVYRHKSPKKLLEVTLETGRKVCVTEDHSLFVLNKGKIISKLTSFINPQDYIVVPRRIPQSSDITEINLIKEMLNKLPKRLLDKIFVEGLDKENFRRTFHSRKDYMRYYNGLIPLSWVDISKPLPYKRLKIRLADSKYRIPAIIKVNIDLMKILGYYTAEGYLGKWGINYSFGSHEKDLHADLSGAIENIFGIKPRIYSAPSKKTEVDVIAHGALFRYIFKYIFEYGNVAHDKKVPNIVYNVSNELKDIFVKCYLEGDGNKRSGLHTGYELTTVSQDLSVGLQFLMCFLESGYSISKFASRKRIFVGYTSECAPVYRIYLPKEDIVSPSLSSINLFPIKESGLYELALNYPKLVNSINNSFKMKSMLLNQSRMSFDNLIKGLSHMDRRALKIKEIFNLLRGDLAFLRVKKIKEIDYDKEYVYDLCIDGFENFVGGFGPICLHNSGTADTVEVLCPVSLSVKEVTNVVKKTNGCLVWGGAMGMASADDRLIKIEKLLSLDPRGLLLASIMAKKMSVGATHVLVDIPCGKEAKIKNMKEALKLKRQFIELSKKLGIKVRVIITNGSQPIGKGIGPVLEARDVINVLKGNGPDDLREKSLHMAGIMLEMIGEKNGLKIAKEILNNGTAYKKMIEIIKIQGGNLKKSLVNKLGRYKREFYANKTGIVKKIDNNKANSIARISGAPEDKFAGVLLNVKINSKVKKGELIFTIFSSNKDRLKYASSDVEGFIEVK